jgi:hypothetical protein
MCQFKCLICRITGPVAYSTRVSDYPVNQDLVGSGRSFTWRSQSCSILCVSFRRPILFALIMLLSTAPLLTCVPVPSMTDAEMACCKKMAGNCDMGTGNHSCCKTTVSTPQLVAISHSPQVHQPNALVAVPTKVADTDAGVTSEIVRLVPYPIPISPPGSQSILRI